MRQCLRHRVSNKMPSKLAILIHFSFGLGSSIKHILVTKAAAQMKQAPTYFARGQQPKFQAMSAAEEENTCAEGGSEEGDDQEMNRIGSFEEYREL